MGNTGWSGSAAGATTTSSGTAVLFAARRVSFAAMAACTAGEETEPGSNVKAAEPALGHCDGNAYMLVNPGKIDP